jgi:ribosomal-protein-alanine N-acetyltransferase
VTPHLRDYRAADFETLYEIDRVCFDPSIAYSRGELREFLGFPGAECIVAEAGKHPGQKIAGFIVTLHRSRPKTGGEGYIVTIDVLLEYRRSAVGSALLDEAEKRMAADGVRQVSLETATGNASAIAFWQKHGYRTRGVKTGYYPGGRDAFSMIKVLPPPAKNQKARS